MSALHDTKMPAQGSAEGCREHGHSVPAPFAVADGDLATGELEVFHAEVQTLHEAEPRPVQMRNDQPRTPGPAVEHSPGLFPGEHDRQAPSMPSTNDTINLAHLPVEDVAVQE